MTFVSDRYETEYMHLFTAHGFEGELTGLRRRGTEVGEKGKRCSLCPCGKGTGSFSRLLREDAPFFSLKLVYQGDKLVGSTLTQ